MIKYIDMDKRREIKTIILVLVAALLLCSLSGCASWDNFKKAFIDKNKDSAKPIKVAVIEPQTGDAAEAAADEIAGIMLANELYPVVGKRSIDLVFFDNESDTEHAKQSAQAITESEAIMAIGSYSNLLTLASGDVFKEAGFPAVAASCTNPLITQLNSFYVSVNTIDTYEALAAADFAVNGSGSRNAAALYIAGSDYSKAQADAFAERVGKITGAENVPCVAIPAEAEDLNDFFETLDRSDTEVVFLPENIENSEKIIKNARLLGFNFKWIGTHNWVDITLEDVYYTTKYASGRFMSEITEEFMIAFKEKYGEDAVPSELFAMGFDSYLVALNCIKNTADLNNKEMIAANLRKTEDLPGATGVINIGENGSATKPVYINHTTENGVLQIYICTPQQ